MIIANITVKAMLNWDKMYLKRCVKVLKYDVTEKVGTLIN